MSAPAPGRRELVDLGGLRVRVHRLGPGGGTPTVVLLHGAGLSARYLLRLAMDLAADAEVVVLDLPGAAGLPGPRRALSVPGQAGAVHRVLRILEVGPVVLLGHSMGAQLAVELLARQPATYRDAVLVGPPVNAAERTLPRQLLRFAQTAVHEPARFRQLALRAYLATATDWLFRAVPVMLGYPIEERIAAVDPAARVRILRGERDRLVPAGWARELAARCGGACEVQEVPGAAHSILVGHRGAVAAAVRDLLTPAGRDRPAGEGACP